MTCDSYTGRDAEAYEAMLQARCTWPCTWPCTTFLLIRTARCISYCIQTELHIFVSLIPESFQSLKGEACGCDYKIMSAEARLVGTLPHIPPPHTPPPFLSLSHSLSCSPQSLQGNRNFQSVISSLLPQCRGVLTLTLRLALTASSPVSVRGTY